MKKLVSICILAMLDRKVIEEWQSAVIAYGLDLLFSSVLTVLSILLIGVWIDREMSIVLLLLISIPLQSFGGGYHCKTHLRCWILTIAGYLAADFAAGYLPVFILWVTALASAYPFLRLAPVENPKAPFGEAFRRKMQRTVRITYFLGIFTAVLFSVIRGEWTSAVLSGITMGGTSVLCAGLCHLRKSFGSVG
ncbi:MAG: accessory gene regulator B family protein [Lachnospiraceae bacterium]|nr:accessory gene regulator B family protein [Lachnospiraceae bacterium]